MLAYLTSVFLPWWFVAQPTGPDPYSCAFGVYLVVSCLAEVVADPEPEYFATIFILGPPHLLWWVAVVWRAYETRARRMPGSVAVGLVTLSVAYVVFLLSVMSKLSNDGWTYGPGLIVAGASGIIGVVTCAARHRYLMPRLVAGDGDEADCGGG
jgi:hypothetical protein